MVALNDALSSNKTYRVITVEKTLPPGDIKGGDWCRYVIALNDETIVGNRRGTLTEVTQYANECAEQLSSRVGRGTSSWASRKKR